MSKLVVFDGNAVMHRGYHAIPPLRGNDGQPINAVYGLTGMLFRTIEDLSPTHIAFAFDRPEPTFRKKLLPEYQGQRPEMESDLSSQFAVAQGVIKAIGIPSYDKAGYEADDVIGTIASIATKEKKVDEVVVVTGDRDMLQLVTSNVKLYMPLKGGLSEAQLFGEREAYGRMGVKPSQIVDYKALVGDPSDNYKGVAGVGPKTAIGLIEKYDTLENIYKHIEDLSPKVKNLLVTHKESAIQSQTLAKIVCDVDVKFDFEKMGKWQIDSKVAFDMYEQVGFNTLAKRAKKLGEKLAREKQGTLL